MTFAFVLLGIAIIMVLFFSIASVALDDPRKEEEIASMWESHEPKVRYGNGKRESYNHLHSYIRQYEEGFLTTREYLELTAKTVREIQTIDSNTLSKCIAR